MFAFEQVRNGNDKLEAKMSWANRGVCFNFNVWKHTQRECMRVIWTPHTTAAVKLSDNVKHRNVQNYWAVLNIGKHFNDRCSYNSLQLLGIFFAMHKLFIFFFILLAHRVEWKLTYSKPKMLLFLLVKWPQCQTPNIYRCAVLKRVFWLLAWEK